MLINVKNFSLPDPGEIVNLTGTTRNASSIVIAWDAPPCPNDVITGYKVYYTYENISQPLKYIQRHSSHTVKEFLSRKKRVVYDITNITLGEKYYIHVRAFSVNNNGLIREGVAVYQTVITLNEQLALPSTRFFTNTTTEVKQTSIILRLPDIVSVFFSDLIEIM